VFLIVKYVPMTPPKTPTALPTQPPIAPGSMIAP
jgi:hypothetical protein